MSAENMVICSSCGSSFFATNQLCPFCDAPNPSWTGEDSSANEGSDFDFSALFAQSDAETVAETRPAGETTTDEFDFSALFAESSAAEAVTPVPVQSAQPQPESFDFATLWDQPESESIQETTASQQPDEPEPAVVLESIPNAPTLAAPVEVEPVEVQPVEVATVEVIPVEVAPVEAVPVAEILPTEITPVEVAPAQVVEVVAIAEVESVETTPVAEMAAVEVIPVVEPIAEIAPVVVAPVEATHVAEILPIEIISVDAAPAPFITEIITAQPEPEAPIAEAAVVQVEMESEPPMALMEEIEPAVALAIEEAQTPETPNEAVQEPPQTPPLELSPTLPTTAQATYATTQAAEPTQPVQATQLIETTQPVQAPPMEALAQPTQQETSQVAPQESLPPREAVPVIESAAAPPITPMPQAERSLTSDVNTGPAAILPLPVLPIAPTVPAVPIAPAVSARVEVAQAEAKQVEIRQAKPVVESTVSSAPKWAWEDLATEAAQPVSPPAVESVQVQETAVVEVEAEAVVPLHVTRTEPQAQVPETVATPPEQTAISVQASTPAKMEDHAAPEPAIVETTPTIDETVFASVYEPVEVGIVEEVLQVEPVYVEEARILGATPKVVPVEAVPIEPPAIETPAPPALPTTPPPTPSIWSNLQPPTSNPQTLTPNTQHPAPDTQHPTPDTRPVPSPDELLPGRHVVTGWRSLLPSNFAFLDAQADLENKAAEAAPSSPTPQESPVETHAEEITATAARSQEEVAPPPIEVSANAEASIMEPAVPAPATDYRPVPTTEVIELAPETQVHVVPVPEQPQPLQQTAAPEPAVDVETPALVEVPPTAHSIDFSNMFNWPDEVSNSSVVAEPPRHVPTPAEMSPTPQVAAPPQEAAPAETSAPFAFDLEAVLGQMATGEPASTSTPIIQEQLLASVSPVGEDAGAPVRVEAVAQAQAERPSAQVELIRCKVCDNQMPADGPFCLVCGTPNHRLSAPEEPEWVEPISSPATPDTHDPFADTGLAAQPAVHDPFSTQPSTAQAEQPAPQARPEPKWPAIPDPTYKPSQNQFRPTTVVTPATQGPMGLTPGMARPKPGTPEYDEMARQAMARLQGGGATGSPQAEPSKFMQPPSTPQFSPTPQAQPSMAWDPSMPRPKPGTPEYDEMARQAMARLQGGGGGQPAPQASPAPFQPSYTPPTQAQPEPAFGQVQWGSAPGQPRPRPGTPEYEEMARQALSQRRGGGGGGGGGAPTPYTPSPDTYQPAQTPADPGIPGLAPGQPRPKPGTPEYEAMVRAALNQRLGKKGE